MSFDQSKKLLELLDNRARLEGEAANLKRLLGLTNNEISALVKSTVDGLYEREGKASGTLRFVLGNHTFKTEVDKTVTWDNDALRDIARELPVEEAEMLFRVKYTVPETAFKAVLNPGLRARLTCARIVKYGEPKIFLDD